MRENDEFPVLVYPEEIQEEVRPQDSILAPVKLFQSPSPKKSKLDTPSIMKTLQGPPENDNENVFRKSPQKILDFGSIMSQQEKDDSPTFTRVTFVDDDLDIIEIQSKLRHDVEQKQNSTKRY